MFRERARRTSVETKSPLGLRAIGPYNDFLEKWYRQSRGEILPNTRLAAVFIPGMRRGIITTGILSGLQDAGFTPEGVQVLVGSSVGSAIAREYGARDLSKPEGWQNNIRALLALFMDDRIKTENGVERAIFQEVSMGKLLNFVRTEEQFRDKGASEEAVAAAVPEIYMGLWDMVCGGSRFVSTREMSDTVVAAISSMTINFITERNLTPIKLKSDPKNADPRMYSDPFHKGSELIRFAAQLPDVTDIGVFFNGNPLVNDYIDSPVKYAASMLEHYSNLDHLFQRFYQIRSADQSPRFYRHLFSGMSGVNISGFFPRNMPMAPNEQDFGLLAEVAQESISFGHQIGYQVRDRLLMAS